jgi:putative membrane protein insertion efficiency factor
MDHAQQHSASARSKGLGFRWDLPIVWPLLALLFLYRRWVSPLFPPACRFEPSCSRYAQAALHEHHAPRALGLIAWRLLRCQPWCTGGHDPVPHRRPRRS